MTAGEQDDEGEEGDDTTTQRALELDNRAVARLQSGSLEVAVEAAGTAVAHLFVTSRRQAPAPR